MPTIDNRYYVKIPAESTTYSTIIEKKPLPIYPASVDNMHIAPAYILLSNADLLVGNALDRREDRLLNSEKRAVVSVFYLCLVINATGGEVMLISKGSPPTDHKEP